MDKELRDKIDTNLLILGLNNNELKEKRKEFEDGKVFLAGTYHIEDNKITGHSTNIINRPNIILEFLIPFNNKKYFIGSNIDLYENDKIMKNNESFIIEQILDKEFITINVEKISSGKFLVHFYKNDQLFVLYYYWISEEAELKEELFKEEVTKRISKEFSHNETLTEFQIEMIRMIQPNICEYDCGNCKFHKACDHNRYKLNVINKLNLNNVIRRHLINSIKDKIREVLADDIVKTVESCSDKTIPNEWLYLFNLKYFHDFIVNHQFEYNIFSNEELYEISKYVNRLAREFVLIDVEDVSYLEEKLNKRFYETIDKKILKRDKEYFI